MTSATGSGSRWRTLLSGSGVAILGLGDLDDSRSRDGELERLRERLDMAVM
jgi:hypothetical protein